MNASVVVGRVVELAAGSRFLDDLSEARGPRALLMYGEAGIGKSTVWAVVVEQARQRGLRVLRTAPSRAESRHAYGALADLLAGVPETTIESLPGPQSDALLVALLRSRARTPAPDPRTIATALLGVVTVLSVDGPVVLAVDDAQWLDTPSARALEFCLRRLGNRAVGLLVSQRTEGEFAPPLGLVRSLDGQVTSVEIGPIPPDDIREVLRVHLDAVPSSPVLRRIAVTSGGNPFFALELARSSAPRGVRGSSVPPTLRDMVARRLEALPARTARVLLAAAAARRPTMDVLRRVAGRDADRGIADAVEARVVVVQDGEVAFLHPVLAAVAYDRPPADERRRMHAALARVSGDAEERAHHLSKATVRPDAGIAGAVAEGAAAARERGAPDAAADLAEAAIRLTPSADPALRLRRMVDSATHHFAAGDAARARELLEAVVEDPRATAVLAEACLRLALIRHHADDQHAAVELLHRAVAEAGDDDAIRAEAEQHLSWAVSMLGNIPDGARHAARARKLSESIGDNAAISRALAMVVAIDFLQGRGVRTSLLKRSLAHEDWSWTTPVQWRPSFIDGYIRKFSGDIDGGRDALAAVRRRLADRGDEAAMPWLLWHSAELEFMAGRWDESMRLSAEAISVSESTGQHLMRAFALSAIGYVEGARGGHDAARAAASSGLELAQLGGLVPAIQFNSSALALVDLAEQNHAAVHARLGPLAKMLATVGLGEPSTLRFLPDEVEALVALGELDAAVELLDPFEERAVALGRTWALAAAHRCRALLESARGHTAAAVEACDLAESSACDLAEPFEVGRTLLAAGRVRRRAKAKRTAKAALGEAASIFETLGSPVWKEMAVAELERVGLRPAAPSELTPTEQRVAALVAQGMTNKQIATAVFMTPRSVEGVIARVYRKLGVSSRARLATAMTSVGFAEGPAGADAGGAGGPSAAIRPVRVDRPVST